VTSRQHQRWIDAGKPFRMSRPVGAVVNRLRAYGYTVGTIGNDAHLNAQPPEDHTLYSETGWPIASPYGTCNAGDLMPGPPNLPNWRDIMDQMVRDKKAGVLGAQFIKFVNRELPGTTTCVQDSFKPNHAQRSSSDRGHGHFSGRSDMTDSSSADSYDPVARYIERIGGGTMADPNWGGWPAPAAVGDRPLAILAGELWTEEQYGRGVYGTAAKPDKSARQLQLDRIEAQGAAILANQAKSVTVTLPAGFAETVANIVAESVTEQLGDALGDEGFAQRVGDHVAARLNGLTFVHQP
jgi:hypothetical protein